MSINPFASDNEIYANTVTSERALWRKEIRIIVDDVAKLVYDECEISKYQREINKIYAKLSVRLNPFDKYDCQILNTLIFLRENYISDGVKNYDPLESGDYLDYLKQHFDGLNKYEIFNIFLKSIQLLLKDDWERVKFESKPFFSFLKSD